MAKVKVSDYVETLRRIVEDSQPGELERNFDGFLRLLRANKQSDLLNEILTELEQVLYAQETIGLATVHCPAQHRPSDEQLARLRDFLRQRFGFSDVELRIVEDGPTAGFLTDVGDYRFDWSFDHQLARFRNAMLTT